MNGETGTGDGDSELAAPLQPASGGGSSTDGDDDEVARTTTGPRTSNLMMLIGAILVIVVAQLVTSFLVLSSTNQLRDQYTSANSLQRCLIHAQLNENQTADPSGTAYKAAVNNCLK
ncbi:MAG TPA: hypothetical protein VLO10_06920 [Candidatus Deferrimicrobium sp.]|nr:hypothetical protein [Candidatus Deferrimicrobium sp.]